MAGRPDLRAGMLSGRGPAFRQDRAVGLGNVEDAAPNPPTAAVCALGSFRRWVCGPGPDRQRLPLSHRWPA